MTGRQVLTGIALTVLAVACMPATAATPDIVCDLECEFVSAYVWRGLTINDEFCFQPSLTLTEGDFSINVWGTWDLTDVPNSSQHTRVDASMDYTTAYGRHIVTLGVVGYMYPDEPAGVSADTAELFASYAFDVASLPSVSLYYDLEKDGVYLVFALAHSFELHDRVALDLSVSLGAGDEHYNDEAVALATGNAGPGFNPTDPTLVDVTARMMLPIYVTDRLLVTPSLKFVSLLDSDIRDAMAAAGMDEDQVVYGVSASLTF